MSYHEKLTIKPNEKYISHPNHLTCIITKRNVHNKLHKINIITQMMPTLAGLATDSLQSYFFVIVVSTFAAVAVDVLLFRAFSDDDDDANVEYSELVTM